MRNCCFCSCSALSEPSCCSGGDGGTSRGCSGSARPQPWFCGDVCEGQKTSLCWKRLPARNTASQRGEGRQREHQAPSCITPISQKTVHEGEQEDAGCIQPPRTSQRAQNLLTWSKQCDSEFRSDHGDMTAAEPGLCDSLGEEMTVSASCVCRRDATALAS